MSDNGSSHIYEYTAGGARSTFASTPDPLGLAFDSTGNLFVGINSAIYEYTPGGVQSTFASGLSGPRSLAFDSAGDLFEADLNTGNIYEFTPGGVRSTFVSGLGGPEGLAFDSAGNLFVGANNSTIYEYTPGGVQSTFASGLSDPQALAFDSAGNLFETDYGSDSIIKITPGGVRSTFASGLFSLHGLAFDSTGDLFAQSSLNGGGIIYEFTPGYMNGQMPITFASGSGLSPSLALAFQGETLPVPEPSALGLLAVSLTALLVSRRFARVEPRCRNRI